MKQKPKVPKVVREWPNAGRNLAPTQVVAMYQQGFAGTIYDEQAREQLHKSMPFPDGEQAAYDFGIVGSGAGKLSLPYVASYKHWPKCWPCPGQTTGDCVSHAGKNAGLVLIGVECELAQPDPETGKIEGFPEISAEAEAQGVVACENIYGDRGHRGEGASCDTLIHHCTTDGGIMLRRNYPEINLDLTKYNANIGIGWGGSGTPENVKAVAREHQIRMATEVLKHEAGRDFIANGYPLWACSGLGWSSERDENGYSRQSGSWAHSWIIMAYDDRDKTKQKYGFPLALYNHDWAVWNKGGRRILGTDLDIPEGSMWIDARLLDRCDVWAMSNLNGWPRRQLPDWDIGWN